MSSGREEPSNDNNDHTSHSLGRPSRGEIEIVESSRFERIDIEENGDNDEEEKEKEDMEEAPSHSSVELNNSDFLCQKCK